MSRPQLEFRNFQIKTEYVSGGPISRANQIALNVTTVLVSLAAIAMTGVRVRQVFVSKNAEIPKPRNIVAWRAFALGGQRVGPSATPVTIVEFFDFQCPFCKQAEADLHDIQGEFPGKVAIVYRQFPLPAHPFAADAARASECAARQGRFERYKQVLFGSEDAFGKSAWVEFAQEADVTDLPRFRRCLSDREIGASINQDEAAGKLLGLTGTPTFLINNLEITGYPGKSALENFVRSAVNGVKSNVTDRPY